MTTAFPKTQNCVLFLQYKLCRLKRVYYFLRLIMCNQCKLSQTIPFTPFRIHESKVIFSFEVTRPVTVNIIIQLRKLNTVPQL